MGRLFGHREGFGEKPGPLAPGPMHGEKSTTQEGEDAMPQDGGDCQEGPQSLEVLVRALPFGSGFPLLGGESPEPLFSRRGLGTPLLPAVCGRRSTSLQPPGQVQGTETPTHRGPRGSCCWP